MYDLTCRLCIKQTGTGGCAYLNEHGHNSQDFYRVHKTLQRYSLKPCVHVIIDFADTASNFYLNYKLSELGKRHTYLYYILILYSMSHVGLPTRHASTLCFFDLFHRAGRASPK